MTDHANELRRHARKIPHPQGETPGVMLLAADEIERLRSESSRLQKEADKFEDGIDWVQRALQAEAKVEEMRGRLPCQDISKWPNYGAQPAPSAPSGLHPLETVRFWADAYTHPGDDNFRGHGMAAALLREYAELRAALAAAPGARL